MSAPHGNDPLRPSHLPGPAAAARERPDRFAGPLVGAHVSPAGGLWKAVERGIDRGAESIQIFNQSPRAWRPTAYGEDDFARFRAALAASPVATVMIHAVYLLNCATDDPEIAGKSQAALIGALRMGDAIGAHSVVLHPGSAKLGPVAGAIERAGRMFAAALAESDRCPLHLENTAGAGGTLGRSFDELAALLDAAGADPRLGLCLDSCHLLASGYEIRAPEDLAAVIDECERAVGPGRIGSLHLNDSQTPLGSNRDRHANLGEGELGLDGCRAFLREARFAGLPCVLETPGVDRSGPSAAEVALAISLRDGD